MDMPSGEYLVDLNIAVIAILEENKPKPQVNEKPELNMEDIDEI